MRLFAMRLFSPRYMLPPNELTEAEIDGREIYAKTIRMALPSTMEAVLIALISMVDTVMVGGLGASAVAAVGITGQPKYLFFSLIMSLNVAVVAIVARRRGQGDKDGANRCLKQCVMLSTVIAVAMSVLCVFFGRDVIRFAGAGDDIVGDATAYFQIIMVGFLFSALSMTINAAQRGIGNTSITMKTNLTANIINVIFNYLLINGNLGFPEMGVRGAAVATLIGTFVGFIMSLRSVSVRGEFLFMLDKEGYKFDADTLKSIYKVSVGAVIEQVFIRIGFFSYSKIVASLGTIAFATHQICMNIINIPFCFGDGMGIASSALVGQSLGAKRKDLAKIYGMTGQRITLLISSVLFVIFMTLRRPIMRIFTDDAAIIGMGANIMILIAIGIFTQTAQVVYSGCLRGAGDSKFIAITSFASIAVVRPILTYALCFPLGLGLYGAWLSLLFDQMTRFVITYVRFKGDKWTNIRI